MKRNSLNQPLKLAVLGCAMALGFIACKNNDLPINDVPEASSKVTRTMANENQADVLQTVSSQSGCLVFDSIGHMEQVIDQLLHSDNEVVAQFYAKHNFISLKSLLSTAMEECSKITSREQYNGLREKYAPFFLFNTQDDRDLPPYLRIENTLYASVLNTLGEAIVGGVKMNFNEYTSFAQTKFYKSQFATRGVDSGENWVCVNDGKRKMWAGAENVNQAVYLRFWSQVSSFWGWNVYDEAYRFLVYENETFDSKWYQFFYARGVRHETYSSRDDVVVELGRQYKPWPEVPSTKAGGMYYHVKETLEVHSRDMGPGNTVVLPIEFTAY